MRTCLLLVVMVLGPVAADAGACDLPAGQRSTLTLEVQGLRREALVWTGARVTRGQAPPLVLAWHGWGDQPANMVRAVQPEQHWSDGVVVVPQGLPRTLHELDPRFRGPANPGWQILSREHDGRDLAYFDALLAHLEKRGCADPRRVYSTGFSNGGFFSNLLGCVRGSKLAAIAPIGGGGPFPNDTACGTAVPVLIVHGLRDRIVPVSQAGGSYDLWQRRSGCAAPTALPMIPGCTSGAACGPSVKACLFPGGHGWPQDIAALLSGFFRQHRR